MSNFEGNPFAALFSPTAVEDTKKEVARIPSDVSTLLSRVFLISTPSSTPDFPTVQLENCEELTKDSLDYIIFERALLTDPSTKVVGSDNLSTTSLAAEPKVIFYLDSTFSRSERFLSENIDVLQHAQKAIVQTLAILIEEPATVPNQNLYEQVHELFYGKFQKQKSTQNLFKELIVTLDERNVVVPQIFIKVLASVANNLSKCSLQNVSWFDVEIIRFYASCSYLGKVLLKSPSQNTGERVTGRSYQNTALGFLLSISCIPKHPAEGWAYYKNPLKSSAQDHEYTQNAIRSSLKSLRETIVDIFMSILKNTEMQGYLLTWIEECLINNLGRSGVWHLQAGELQGLEYSSDGFMLNLAAILLQLAQPIVSGAGDLTNISKCKVFKVDPTYVSKVAKDAQIPGLYSEELYKATCLLPTDENDEPMQWILPKKYTFPTSCFYLTHRALQLSWQVLIEKIKKLSQELNLIQRELERQTESNSPNVETVRMHMEMKTTQYLTFMSAMFERSFVDNLLQFLSATSLWLTQASIKSDNLTMPMTFETITMDKIMSDDDSTRMLLKLVPEFFVETIVSSLIAIDKAASDSINICEDGILHHFVTFIASFMGSTKFINNPHLRAQMCECLNAMLVKSRKSSMSNYHERAFLQHPLSLHLVTAVIEVFVSIEMTGSAVAFEEKFNYRRPMYDVMEYFWELPSHKKQFTLLATHSLENMESAKPPLFLRFVNLLINDAIFLLDEGLSFMSQIREKQIERDNGDWDKLPAREQQELRQNFSQMQSLAKFHNALGTCTIETLMRFTKDIPKMFTHATLVDRIASMLNYFLNNLVGPKQSKLKVKDMDRYEFRPGEVVSNICTIYTHLISEKNFGVAVSNDGRSYTPQLFVQASKILGRLGKANLSDDITKLGKQIENYSVENKNFDHLTQIAPERYLDPIMMHIMMDPVMLPSSKIIVDRQTIARHLLSDQSDPFNRQSLTMEEVLPEIQLKQEIQQWVDEELKKA